MEPFNKRVPLLATTSTSIFSNSKSSLIFIFLFTSSFFGTTSAHGNHMAIPEGQFVSADPIVSFFCLLSLFERFALGKEMWL